MTLVLLDTNAYLRFAKRVKPLLGISFGQKGYVLTILPQVENEVHQSAKLRFQFPWFDNVEIAQERLAKRIKLSQQEKDQLAAASSILRAHVLDDVTRFSAQRRSPPSPTDCEILAFGQVRSAIVVTDDLGMHLLAKDFDIRIWHAFELLKKMQSAKLIGSEKVREIYEALETNNDLDQAWREAKHTLFKKIFGQAQK